MTRLSIYIAAAAWTAVLFFGCTKEKNPVSDHEQHTRAVGCVIKLDAEELVRAEKGKVTGSLTIKERFVSPLMQFYLIAEDGDLFQPADEEYIFNWESKKQEIADALQYQTDGRWSFRLKGIKAGSTALVFKVLHGDHADFVSADIPVTVTPADGGGL